MKRTPVFGILGGIGSGKSAVARGLADHMQVCVVDADRIGHEVLTFPQIKHQIREAFGAGVFVSTNPAGEIDRSQLAKRVFGTHHKSSLTKLESIVHPEIRRQIQQQIERAQAKVDVVIIDAAVMLEAGWNDLCEFLVFVDVPYRTRLARVVENRGWDEAELRRREASQIPVDAKKNAATFVVDNSGNLEASVRQFRQIVDSVI